MGYYGYGYDATYILVIIGLVITLMASASVKNTFKRYSKYAASCNLTGADVARAILKENGLYDVRVEHVSGSLTDHYNPATKVVNLSDSVYASNSIAAISVAAHECGHAVQHGEDYVPLKIRSSIVPVANWGSKLGVPMIFLGVILSWFQPLITLGVLLFSFSVLFQLVTLPVEFDASRRALVNLDQMGIVQNDELKASKAVLKSAAMTYVAAAAASILSLLRLIILYGGGGKKRRG